MPGAVHSSVGSSSCSQVNIFCPGVNAVGCFLLSCTLEAIGTRETVSICNKEHGEKIYFLILLMFRFLFNYVGQIVKKNRVECVCCLEATSILCLLRHNHCHCGNPCLEK